MSHTHQRHHHEHHDHRGHNHHHHSDEHHGYNSRIEAVTVCLGYDDFLAETIRLNIHNFDRWIIITSPEDIATRDVCRKHSIECLLSHDHHRDGEFNKGRLIERGLQLLSTNSWRVHIDADTILPQNFRNIIKSAHLDEDCIYGADRLMIRSREKWEALKRSGWYHGNDFHCRVPFPFGYSLGDRWADHDGGYVPIGYFQMWHSNADLYKGARIKPYSIRHNDACRSDVQFALQWDRRQRICLPEFIVLHLESEPAALGANWAGRTTKRF